MKRYKNENGRKLIYESYDRLLAGWAVPYESHNISTSYGITHVITAGSPDLPPLLLLHGTGDNVAMMWIYNVAELSRNFRIIAVDNIGGSGKSEPNDRYARDFKQAEWLDEILEAMNVDAVYIAGVSYGAYLAYHYTIVRPDRVNKIVCLAGGISGSQFEVMSKMMRAFLPEALFPSERNVRKLLRKLCGIHADAFENNPELMQHWFYLLKYFNNRSMMKHTITIHSAADVQAIRNKSLFVMGEQDLLSYYPKAVARLEANGMRYRIVKDAGHAINHEMPELIHEEILGFCREARSGE
ncbi:alpha/beta hydrolase [Paenibacillus sp. EZ-K15]|uniref:alpha/beta fold hydrolase n=1 Tax=Paenibacillus sp. EZ-K15 TaxID=2044275 RepID=UPI000BF28409|nr:alpha/beta hydrolase [Paenibacillus sp. EZ-K15]